MHNIVHGFRSQRIFKFYKWNKTLRNKTRRCLSRLDRMTAVLIFNWNSISGRICQVQQWIVLTENRSSGIHHLTSLCGQILTTPLQSFNIFLRALVTCLLRTFLFQKNAFYIRIFIKAVNSFISSKWTFQDCHPIFIINMLTMSKHLWLWSRLCYVTIEVVSNTYKHTNWIHTYIHTENIYRHHAVNTHQKISLFLWLSEEKK